MKNCRKMQHEATTNRQKCDFWTVWTAPGDPWDGSRGPLGLQGPKWFQKGPFLEPKMDQRSAQERTKIRSIFETIFKRLPGGILAENDVQIGAKSGAKTRSETSSRTSRRKVGKSVKNGPLEIRKMLILPSVLYVICRSVTFL